MTEYEHSDDCPGDLTFGEHLVYAMDRAPVKFQTIIHKYKLLLTKNKKLMEPPVDTYDKVLWGLKFLKDYI